jgi:ferric-dicitrate binding protein FerR (iron transport regulator)
MKTPNLQTIEKVLNNEATSAETNEVVRWFGTPEGQVWLSERMDTDEMSIRLGEEEQYSDHLIPSDEMYQQIMRKLKWQKMRRVILQAAAILIPFILLAGLLVELDSRVDLFASAEYNEVYVPKGERLQLMLQDGSLIHLNSESRVRYPKKFGLSERKIELEGEAWCEIAKEKKRPFIVDLKAFDIRVLGTSFNIQAYSEEENIYVALETGLVNLTSVTFKQVTLNPGEIAIYNRSSGSCVIKRQSDMKLASAWKKNVLVFSDASLSEVIATLSRTFDVTFVIENNEALNYNYTLQTNHRDLSLIIQELEKITPVRFEQNGKTVKIMIKNKRNESHSK